MERPQQNTHENYSQAESIRKRLQVLTELKAKAGKNGNFTLFAEYSQDIREYERKLKELELSEAEKRLLELVHAHWGYSLSDDQLAEYIEFQTKYPALVNSMITDYLAVKRQLEESGHALTFVSIQRGMERRKGGAK